MASAADSGYGTSQMFESENSSHLSEGIENLGPLSETLSQSRSELSRPKLTISSIVNINFKSFAGRHVLGPFNERFSAVIGPNGSGKSNIIDALLFVFGFKSRRIRSKKVSSLIHYSSKHPDLKSCTVEVHFVQEIDQENRNLEAADKTEIVISRTAYKDGTSFYTVNQERVTYKDVVSYLTSNGIDLTHSRFLILQGEVEQISLMKPKGESETEVGFLEYLEDIIGSSKYKEVIQKLSEEADKLTAAKNEKLAMVKIAEREMNHLEEPKNKAIRYLTVKNELVKTQHIILQKSMFDVKERIKGIQTEYDCLQKQLISSEKRRGELCKKKEAKSECLNVLLAEKTELSCRLEQVKEEIRQLTNRQEEIKQELMSRKKMKHKAEKKCAEEHSKVQQMAWDTECLLKDINDLCRLQEQVKKEQELKEETLDRLIKNENPTVQKLAHELQKCQTELMPLEDILRQKKSVLSAVQSEYDSVTSQKETEVVKLKELEKERDHSNHLLQKHKLSRMETEKEIFTLKTKLKDLQEKLDLIRQELQSAEVNRQNLHQKTLHAKSLMQTSKLKNKFIDDLIRCRNEGELPSGIFGRLGDLGGIDKKYDIAISTACGRLDNIIVDTVQTAQKCIEYMKRAGHKRTTFIALEKVEHLRQEYLHQFKSPEDVPRLFDLIQVEDDRVRPAFYFSIGDTLVASDLKQAMRVAYGKFRHRVVTLKGEIIEITGAMSGGGWPQSGRMGQSVTASLSSLSPQQVFHLEQQLQDLRQSVSKLHCAFDDTEQTVLSKQKQLHSAKDNFCKHTNAVQHLEELVSTLEDQIKAQEEKISTMLGPEKLPDLISRLNSAKIEYNEILEKFSAVDKTVANAKQKLHEERTKYCSSARRELKDVGKKLAEISDRLKKLKFNRMVFERNRKRTVGVIENLQKTIQDTDKKIVVLREVKEEYEKKYSTALEEMKKLKQTLNNVVEQQININKTSSHIETEEKKISFEILELSQKIEDTRIKMGSRRKELHRLSMQLRSLKLDIIPGETNTIELNVLQAEELLSLNTKELEYRIQLLESDISLGMPDLSVIDEYMQREKYYMRQLTEYNELTCERNKICKVCDHYRKQRLSEFMEGYNTISIKLREVYQMITQGGDAEFELVNSLDPFSEGIGFSVRPPQKAWKHISALSGGEKTISSLALVFALHYYRPSPFYILDEIDAALDINNVRIVALYIKERARNSQFIIISLRSGMFEIACRLIGICKCHDVSGSFIINPHLYVQNKEETTDLD